MAEGTHSGPLILVFARNLTADTDAFNKTQNSACVKKKKKKKNQQSWEKVL